MDIKEIVENAMSEAESKYPPSDVENALENVLKRAENTAPGEERAAVRANAAAATNVRTGEHKIIKALAGIAAVAAVLAGTFLGLKYLSDNNIELLKEGGGNVTVTGTNEPAVTAAQVTKDEDPSTPNVDSFTATSADEWEKEMHRQTFYYPFLAINVIPESLLSLAAPQELAEWELMSVDAEKYPPEHITDYANICTFINHFGISSEDAKKSLGDEWQENVSRLFQEERLDRVVDMICSGDCGKDTEEELCTNVVWYFDGRLICPNWLYVHSLEDWKTAGVKAATINTMYDYYTHNGVLSEEQTAEFKAKLDRYIAENNQRDESEYEYNEDGDVLPIEAPDALPDAETESTTETSAEITTNALLYETEAETTEPAEVSPTDDELKALVEQGAEACGLKITVSDLTKASLKLNYYCEGDNSKYLAFMWGGKYEIQILSGNEWMTYDPDNFRRWNDEQMWFDSSFSINEFPNHSDEHETILFYGDNMYESEIPKGNYRVLKQIAVYGNGKNLGQLTAYTEFTIDEHTPNIFGITMTAKNVSPESVTLAVQQSGASFHVKRNLGYKARFVLESKTGSGEWKKVEGNPVTWAPDIEPINENGVTEIKEDFSDIYGSLSDGTYRISKQFVNYVGNGETEDDIINSSTYYCEFVIGEKTHDWGITMSAKDVTSAGMTLVIDRKGGDAAGEIDFGEKYHLEIKNDENGMWERLRCVGNDVCFVDIATMLDPGAHIETKIDWTYLYSYLHAGHYRFVKQFTELGSQEDCDFYMEFDVPEIDSKLGITLNTKRNTARWITLDAASIGDTVSEHMSFNENRYVIEQKKNGKWTEYYTTAVPGIPTPETARKINAGDVVTFTVDWRERAGSLPVGEYRIGITFTGGSVSETIYAEFTVEEYMTNEFGLQIQPIEVSRTGGKFGINSLGGEKDGRARYTNAFLLQKQASDGEWKGVKHVHEDGDTGIINYYIGLHTGAGCIGNLEKVAWSYFFGALKNGHYRLGKTFREDVDGEAEQIEVYCEFDITDDTPEKLE